MFWLLMIFVALGVSAFVYVGIGLFSEEWEKKEEYEQYEDDSLDLILLTIPPQHILYLSMIFAFLGMIFCYFLFGSEILSDPFGLILIGVPFGLIPPLGIRLYRRRREKLFGLQLIDALTTLSNSLRAGYSLPKAFEVLAKEAPDPLGQEMRIVVQELRLGETIVDALKNLHKRVPNEDLELLTTAIAIASEVGGNLSEVFDNIAHTIRERNRIEGRIKALTAQGRAQGWVVGMLPIILALAVNYIEPDLFRPMYTTVIGWIMLGAVVILEILGIFFIMKIVNIKV